MRFLLPLASTALVLAFALAPPVGADDEKTPGWSEAQGVPAKSESAVATPEATRAADDTAPSRETSYRSGEAPTGTSPTEAVAFVMPKETTVLGIWKRHNQPWFGNWLALELDMAFAVIGQPGRNIGASVTFFEEANGRPLRSRMLPYVDADGSVSVYTKLVPVSVDSGVFTSKLKIPYRAFPWPSKGSMYTVEARVRLLRQEADGSFHVLTRGNAHFTIRTKRVGDTQARDPSRGPRWRGWERNSRYDWEKMWGDDMGKQPSEEDLPPPKGPGAKKEWFEWRCRTRK